MITAKQDSRLIVSTECEIFGLEEFGKEVNQYKPEK